MAMMMAQVDSSTVAGKEREELAHHRTLGDDRDAEIAVHELVEIDQILLPDRQVEAVLVQQLGVALRLQSMLARHKQRRVAGQDAHEREGDETDTNKRRYQQPNTPKEEPQHGLTRSPYPSWHFTTGRTSFSGHDNVGKGGTAPG